MSLNPDIDDLLVCDFECPYDVFVEDKYECTSNPDGIICAAYAENLLLWDVLEPKIRSFRLLQPQHTQYEYSYGSADIRAAFSQFLGRFTTRVIQPNQLIVASGCSAVLDILVHTLCCPDEGILVPTPCYHNFERAFSYRNQTRFLSVPTIDLDPAALQASLDEHKATGVTVKAFLLTTPHSPTGRVYTRSELEDAVQFCMDNGLHLIADETYLPHVFQSDRSERAPSVLDLIGDDEQRQQRVHVITSLSKLGMAGFKVGTLFSANDVVIQACRKLSWFCQVSTDTQFLVTQILNDVPFTDRLIAINKDRLRDAYANAVQHLQQQGIPYVEAGCGLTVLLDFRHAIGDDEGQCSTEEKLFNLLLHDAKVLLTKGTDMRCAQPGFFRLTFANDMIMVTEAIRRLGAYMRTHHPAVRAASAALRLQKIWARSDLIFGMLTDDGIMQKPIDLRHPFIFYLGHLPAFAWNQIKAVTGADTWNEEFDTLFERGIDPDVETGKVHKHSCDRKRTEWPSVDQILAYRDQVRTAIVAQLTGIYDDQQDSMKFNGRVVELAMEHELMHQETLLYMFHQLDRKYMTRPDGASTSMRLATDIPVVRNPYVQISAGPVSMGVNEDEIKWGWDNEFPRQKDAWVDTFVLQKYPVTNGDYLAFVNSGGYANRSLWTDSDWEWKEEWNITHPIFWSYNSESSKWVVSSMFDVMPLSDVLDWPVTVSQAEASAYCRWVNGRLPTEEEWVRAAYSTRNSDNRSRKYPWGNEEPTQAHGNFHFGTWSPTPVNAHPRGASAWGIHDLLGNGWEWTSSKFNGFPGFKANIETYQGYSQDFFDDKHFVMRGASWATDAQLMRPSFRNWYQGHYPYVFSKFRVARDSGLAVSLDSGASSSSSSSSPSSRPARTGSVGSLGSVDDEAALAAQMPLAKVDNNATLCLLSDGSLSGLDEQFAVDVLSGLSGLEKRVPSVYFYDDVGSELFAAITDLEEYYPTRCEAEILETHRSSLAALLNETGKNLNLVELGAGDGKKTAILLKYLVQSKVDVTYVPIDISQGALHSLQGKMRSQFAEQDLRIVSLVADNIDGLRWVSQHSDDTQQSVVMFLGSSIGNYDEAGAIVFLQSLWHAMQHNDYLLIGFDLKKDVKTLVAAYNDSQGVTTEFNMNLLDRMNQTLSADFDRDSFIHCGNYNPRSGAMESWLISTKPQEVYLGKLKKRVRFAEWEGMRTEYSFKYTRADIAMLAEASGFTVVDNFEDSNGWFVDSLWRVVKE